MSKIAIAVGSFIIGVCVAFAASSLLHASPQAQRLEIVGAEPVVPPLNANFVGGTFSGPAQPLDGFSCQGCNIIAPVLTYAGGAFRCENCAIHSSELQFKGAALNTVAILKLVGAIKGSPPGNSAKPQNSLMEAKMDINIKQKVTWVSLEGLQK
jgi:hypothetical protein